MPPHPKALEPFHFTTGPHDAQVVIVGEAHGEQEELTGMPFFGASGQELTRMLGEAGIERSHCLLTNVFAFRPPNNNVEALCGPKAEVGKDYPFSPYRQGKYFLWEHLPHLERLQAELRASPRHLVLALGNTACWALMGSAGIGSIRGTIGECQLVDGLKVLPTYHPAAVLRNWALRPIVLADLLKAARESLFPDIRRPRRTVLINPSLEEIWEWVRRPADMYCCDVETKVKQITVLGFARSRDDALVVPFWNVGAQAAPNYWPTLAEELEARRACQEILGGPVPKLYQNGLYDIQYLLREGFCLRNCAEDTMLLHHSLYPEMQKGLGFLGSIYTGEASWKLLNRPQKAKDDKKDA